MQMRFTNMPVRIDDDGVVDDPDFACKSSCSFFLNSSYI